MEQSDGAVLQESSLLAGMLSFEMSSHALLTSSKLTHAAVI